MFAATSGRPCAQRCGGVNATPPGASASLVRGGRAANFHCLPLPTDPTSKKRNVKLMQTQTMQTKNGQDGANDSMIHPVLWAKAEELVAEEAASSKQ